MRPHKALASSLLSIPSCLLKMDIKGQLQKKKKKKTVVNISPRLNIIENSSKDLIYII